MALVSAPLTYAQGAVAVSGTSVALTSQPPDNCHTLQVTNPSSTVTGYVGTGAAGGAITPGVNGFGIGPGMTRTLGIGTIQDRGTISNLIADSLGGAVTLEILFINLIGPY